ncbi:hypothetical protein D3C84_535230 [compost metagenome]
MPLSAGPAICPSWPPCRRWWNTRAPVPWPEAPHRAIPCQGAAFLRESGAYYIFRAQSPAPLQRTVTLGNTWFHRSSCAMQALKTLLLYIISNTSPQPIASDCRPRQDRPAFTSFPQEQVIHESRHPFYPSALQPRAQAAGCPAHRPDGAAVLLAQPAVPRHGARL